jgi:hypothetical protein
MICAAIDGGTPVAQEPPANSPEGGSVTSTSQVTVTGRPSVVLGMAAVQLARALHPELRESLK